jgi:hypothetical protein
MKVLMEIEFKNVKLPNGKIESFDAPTIETKQMVRQSVAKFMRDMVEGQKALYKRTNINAEINWKFATE